MPKNFLISIVYITLVVSIWSFDLSLANIYQYSPNGNDFTKKDITKDLFKSLRETDKEGLLSLFLTKSKDIPKSILETAGLCESENIDFILYGFLKVNGNNYDFEIKFYDRISGQIQTVIYSKTSIGNYNNLVQTMSERIISYFYKTLGVTTREEEARKEYGVIDIEWGLGYWIPFDPWAESLLGLGFVHLGSSLTPVDLLFIWDIFSFALSYGIGLDYLPGMNKEGYESYFLHTLRLGFPVTFSALWHYRNKLILQIAPELQVDILSQDRLYGSVVVEKSTVFSLSTLIGYENLFTNNRLSLGFAARLHTAFYRNILFSIEPSFYCRYRFNSGELR